MGDRNTNYEVQKRFIDYAADMHWRYCLIDGLWDTQIGYEKADSLMISTGCHRGSSATN